MSRPFTLIGGLAVLLLLFVAGIYGYRSLIGDVSSPEGYALLTPVPGATGFEPKSLPTGPVLTNEATDGIAVNFGYRVGKTRYSYTFALSFPQNGDAGRATVTARHAGHDASIESNAVRRWDEPRGAYAVAVQDRFDMIQPPVPSLCIKAVIGPEAKTYDLRNASLCVAQRDAGGNCHSETLACGLIR